jgi:hypothetical protein
MLNLKSLTSKITPTIAVSILVAALTLVGAFGAPVTTAQRASILVFGGAVAVVLFAHGLTNAFKYLTPPTLTGLVTGAIGVAISFGAPITAAQSEAVLIVFGSFGGLLLVHGAVHTLARDKREPAPPKPVEVPTSVPTIVPAVAASGPSPAALKAAGEAAAKAAADSLAGK